MLISISRHNGGLKIQPHKEINWFSSSNNKNNKKMQKKNLIETFKISWVQIINSNKTNPCFKPIITNSIVHKLKNSIILIISINFSLQQCFVVFPKNKIYRQPKEKKRQTAKKRRRRRKKYRLNTAYKRKKVKKYNKTT